MFGVDSFLQQAEKYRKLKFALVTNDAATTSDRISNRIALLKEGVDLIRLFSPEHGLSARGGDGAYQKNEVDNVTGLPVISLYGDQLYPAQEALENIDAILFDIPDIGCRFYSYLWTMTFVMESCAKFDKLFFILDRPNPISGDLDLAEGPMLDEENCSSFIGRWSIPIRHSCTLGELANYFNSKKNIGCDIQIFKTQNWKRNETVIEEGGKFVQPSPAITEKNILFYPGTGLLEGINVNEGRGTTEPFKIFGAPWIENILLNEEFEKLKLPGIVSRPYSYRAVDGPYKNEQCLGLSLDIIDPFLFRPVKTGLSLVKLIATLHPENCKERSYVTRANPSGKYHLDRLTGIHDSFSAITSGDPRELASATSWKEMISPFLIY